MTDRTKEYNAYINLAAETLELLHKVKQEQIPEFDTVHYRQLATNLCHFQERWATPMELPFGMGTDLKKPIDVQRDPKVLLNLDCAVENPTENGSLVIRETSTWKYLVENGQLAGEEATEITFAAWIVDLFNVLCAVSKCDKLSHLHLDCRSLASRWYYHASETDFNESNPSSEEPDTAREKRAVVKAQSILNSILFGGDLPEEDEEEDEEFEDADDSEEEEEEEEEDYSNLTEEELKDRSAKAADFKAQGNKLFLANQPEQAVDLYTQAIVTCPSVEPYLKEKAIYYGNRSAALVKLFQFEAVEKDCTKALAIDPNYLKVLLRRANAYEELEMLDEAYQDYKKILEIDPQNYQAQKCSTLLEAVLSDDGSGCINSDMIQSALTNMMAKAAQRREQQLELERLQGTENIDSSNEGDELVFKENEHQTEIREKIIKCVEEMKSYFPHPSQPIYFIRLLEKMKLEPNSPWFPWGTPPVSRMESETESLQDPQAKQSFQEIINALSSAV